MSDAAFPTAAYPGHTNRELLALIDAGSQHTDAMRAELSRRAEVAAGNMTNATPGERLRAVRYGLTINRKPIGPTYPSPELVRANMSRDLADAESAGHAVGPFDTVTIQPA